MNMRRVGRRIPIKLLRTFRRDKLGRPIVPLFCNEKLSRKGRGSLGKPLAKFRFGSLYRSWLATSRRSQF
jgi:hypothetical protein